MSRLLAGPGLVMIVLGTFLPWLQSGRAYRNSYAAGGAIRRLLGTGGVVDHVLALWPLVGLGCAASVAAYLVGLRALAAALAGLAAATSGAAAIAALAASSETEYVKVAIAGPLVTILGAILIAFAALTRAISATAARSPDDQPSRLR